MPKFEYSMELLAPAAKVFEFLTHVENLPRVSPRRPRLQIVEAPPRLFLGARFTVNIRVGLLSRRVMSEVTEFVEGVRFTDVQVEGVFRRWQHTHEVVATSTGCRMTDRIIFEPPPGLMGLFLTEKRVAAMLANSFAFRETRFRELFAT
jgi:ligand-binding SRPBCC domain-containing protein